MSPIDNRIYTLPPAPPPEVLPLDILMGGDPWGGKCPAPWTNILLKDNETKQAKDLKVGDLVHTQHEDTLEWGDYPVEVVKIIPDQKRLSFVFDDGVELVCSLSHKFYLNNTWVEAKDIKVNDILTNKKVTEVKPYENGDVVLITITDAHTYISEGILSHNKSLARPPEGNYIASTPNRTGVDMTGAQVPSSGISSGGLFGNLIGLLGSNYLGNQQQSAFGKTIQGYGNLANQLQSQVQFKPFTVTGTTGGVSTGYDAQGNLQTQYGLGPQGQAIQQAGLGGAQQFFGQAGGIDPTLAAQRGTLGQFFGAQAQQLGQPTGIEGLTSQALAGGQQRIGQAMQPTDINLLRGQFAGQVGGLLGQQPSAALADLSQTAYGMGTQGLRQLSQPADIEALRQQYAGLAGQAASGLLTGTGDREQQIFERIRAAQTPEEQRQRLATEERMAAQGRLGLSSAAYGGSTPELMAQEQAIAEARNRAALGAMDQARAEQAQQLQTAQTLGGLTSQFAGQSSDLQSAAQQRASQLSQLGMSASQIQSQLQSEGLGRGLQTLQGGLQAQEIGSGLQSQAQQRAAQLSQLGMNAEQIQSQLQSEGLGRAAQAGGLAADLASTASGLESQALQRGLSLSGLGMQGTELGQGLTNQQLQNLLALQQAGQTSALAQQQLQAGNVDIGRGLLAAGLAPESQLLNLIQPAINIASLQGTGQREGANLAAQLQIAQMQAQQNAALAEAQRKGQLLSGGVGLLTGQRQGGQQSILDQLLGGLFGGLFGGSSGNNGDSDIMDAIDYAAGLGG